jgi:hypothetical protein
VHVLEAAAAFLVINTHSAKGLLQGYSGNVLAAGHLPWRDGSHGPLESDDQLAADAFGRPAACCAWVAAELCGLEGRRRRRLLHGAGMQRLPVACLELQLQRLALQ